MIGLAYFDVILFLHFLQWLGTRLQPDQTSDREKQFVRLVPHPNGMIRGLLASMNRLPSDLPSVRGGTVPQARVSSGICVGGHSGGSCTSTFMQNHTPYASVGADTFSRVNKRPVAAGHAGLAKAILAITKLCVLAWFPDVQGGCLSGGQTWIFRCSVCPRLFYFIFIKMYYLFRYLLILVLLYFYFRYM